MERKVYENILLHPPQHTDSSKNFWLAGIAGDVVRRRCGGRCERCGAAHSRIEVHHIHPVASREGMTFTKADLDPAGLEALCPPCHWEKTAKMNRRTSTPEEQAWMEFCEELMG